LKHSSLTQRRILIVAALASAATLVLVGCTPSKSTTDTSLTVQVQAAQLPAFKYAANLLEKKHAGLKVKLQTVTEQQETSTNAQILASSNAPDVGIVKNNAQPYFDLMKAKKLIPLTDVWKSANLESRYGKTVATSLKWKGTPYLTMFDTTYYNVVFYNKAAFAKAGVTVPSNHQIANNEDLYSAVSKLKTAGYDGLAVGGSAGYQLGWLVDAQLQANAPKAALQDFLTSWQSGNKQKVKYTSSAFTGSLAQLADWSKHGVFPAGFVAASGDQAQAQFTSGSAAMLIGGTWIPSVLKTQKFDYDWLLLPGANDTPTVPSLYAGDTLAIPTASKHQALAKEFLVLYESDKVQTFAAAKVGSLPAVSTVKAADVPGLGPIVQQIVDYTTKKVGIGWTSTLPGSLGQAFVDAEAQKMLGGQVTVEQAGKDQQKQFETYKSQNG
jgi:raffinose/stachyose/melibiose transport system substrate-binding protein